MSPPDVDDKRKAAREVIDILHEIATLLVSSPSSSCESAPSKHAQNTHLNRQQLSYCVSLIENGVNPEALAVRVPFIASSPVRNINHDPQNVIKELRTQYPEPPASDVDEKA
jgi:mitotic-spindle organizing protein 1